MFSALALPGTAAAQAPIEFFPSTAFHMDAQHLSTDELRFKWAANFFGAIDFLGWHGGRSTFLANYEVVLGDQLRRFDPNQGNYTLEGTVTQRLAGIDVSGEFHHVSRHLADRVKTQAVDWNMLGVRAQKRWDSGRFAVDARADYRGVLAKSYVDYTREVEGALGVRYAVRPRVGIMSNTMVRVTGVDGSRDRGTQTGARIEGGVRLGGPGGALELFLAAERRVDPYPLEFGTARWLTAGFRLLGRQPGQ